MFKLSFIFLLFCVSHNRRGSADIHVPSDVQIVLKSTAEIFKAVSEFFSQIGTIINEAVKSLTGEVFYAIRLRFQLIIMASGISFEQLPHKLYAKFYVNSLIFYKMCGKLTTMERTFDILINSSLDAADFALRFNDTIDAISTWKFFDKSIETKIKEDPTLEAVYNEFKETMPVIPYIDAYAIPQNKTKIREVGRNTLKFILHKLYTQYSNVNVLSSSQKHYFAVARTTIELAKKLSINSQPVQKLYEEAIDETIDLWDKQDIDFYVLINTAGILFDKIENKIRADRILRDKYDETRKIIENDSTKWNKGLLNVDLFPF